MVREIGSMRPPLWPLVIAAMLAMVTISLAQPPAARATPPTAAQIATMQAEVEQHGLQAFNAAALANGWQAPIMPSAWYVTNVSPADQRAYYTAARDLGSALLTAIDAWAPAMRTDGSTDVLSKATALIDLAYWLGTTDGYANLILSQRARDVAATGLTRRVADLNVPLAETAAQLQRMHAPFDEPQPRARVLNFEAGNPLFPDDAATSDAALASVWSGRVASAELNRLPTPALTPNDVNAAAQDMRDFAAVFGITPAAPQPTDVFFRDDPPVSPQTTRTAWALKQHERLLGSMMPQNVYGLETLMQFREVVGDFPLQPAVRQSTILSPGEEAFANAWRPHIGSATFNLGRPAWAVYDRIQRGQFLDADSMQVILTSPPPLDTPTPAVSGTATAADTPTGAP
jgi:hypothetical protein